MYMYRTKQCIQCQTETKNKKFCSSSCAAKYNNIHGKIGRERAIRKCHRCGEPIAYTHRLCSNCKSLIKTNTGELLSINKVTKGNISTNDTQKYRRIRKSARMIAKEHGLLTKCIVCNYSNHVECCHIKPIASYSDNTLVSTINSPKNLCGLCPNHHWELDHNILKMEVLLGVEPKTKI